MKHIIRNRYGPLNLKAPNKYDLDDSGYRTTKMRTPQRELFDKLIYAMRFPPIRGKHYKKYITTIEDYMDSFNNASKQSQSQSRAQICDIHLAGKLLYMTQHPAQYHGFNNFKYTWVFDILSAMRTYTINRRYFNGIQGTNNTTAPWSSGFVPFPRALDLDATSALADILYTLASKRVSYICKKSKIPILYL